VPAGPDGLTPDVLTAILTAAGAIGEGVRIAASEHAGVQSSGLVGCVERLHLSYDPPDAVGPRSVIVKIPATDSEAGRAFAAAEARFYRHRIAERCSLRAPRAYYCRLDQGTGGNCLVLEDLGEHGFVRQIDGCDREQASTAMGEIAKLHACRLGRPLPAELRWIRPVAASPARRFCRRWIRSYNGTWPEALGGAPALLRERFDELAGRLASGTCAIVHGDFHSQNIAFDGAGGPPRLIDFQFVQHASPMVDVARFLATSLQTDLRRAIERDLLDEYQASLRTHGAGSYAVAEHLDELRAALLWNLALPLALHVRRVMAEGRPWPDRFPILERCLAAIHDWNALDLRRLGDSATEGRRPARG
jgi:hypothetical protein